MTEICVELKYCEGCGAQFFRAADVEPGSAAQKYCRRCQPANAIQLVDSRVRSERRDPRGKVKKHLEVIR